MQVRAERNEGILPQGFNGGHKLSKWDWKQQIHGCLHLWYVIFVMLMNNL